MARHLSWGAGLEVVLDIAGPDLVVVAVDPDGISEHSTVGESCPSTTTTSAVAFAQLTAWSAVVHGKSLGIGVADVRGRPRRYVGLTSMSNTAEYLVAEAGKASIVIGGRVGVDVEVDADVAEALADVGVDAEHAATSMSPRTVDETERSSMSRAAAPVATPAVIQAASVCSTYSCGVGPWPMTERGVIGGEGELLHVQLVGSGAVPLVDRGGAGCALDPAVAGGEAKGG